MADPSNRRFANVNNAYVGRARETICQKSTLISLFYVRKTHITLEVFVCKHTFLPQQLCYLASMYVCTLYNIPNGKLKLSRYVRMHYLGR